MRGMLSILAYLLRSAAGSGWWYLPARGSSGKYWPMAGSDWLSRRSTQRYLICWADASALAAPPVHR